MTTYLIIGGVAGGATSAARLRRLDEKAQIIVLEKGEHVSYANCGLPYYIGDVITERDKLFVQTPEGFRQRFNIDVRVQSEALKIDRHKKVVTIRDAKSGKTYDEAYDKLILSPGAFPVFPPIPGINIPGIFTLRSVPDTDAIKNYMDAHNPLRAVIVGAGFIGLEMAENLHHKGLMVTIVEMADQVMNVLDFELASQIHQHLKEKKVELYLKDAIKSFEKRDQVISIRLNSGQEIITDMVILSLGIKPDSKLAHDAGLPLGEYGGISVNEYLQTQDQDIYAVGDAIEVYNPILQKTLPTYLAGPANKQGRIAADNIVSGNHKKYRGAIGTAIAKVFDMTVASTGASEKNLKRYAIPYLSTVIHAASHAGYYPDSVALTIKLLFSPEGGRLLGAQAIGSDGVDKRIDILSTLIATNGSVYDLGEIEHAYAPPYSSAKDPVNIAGFAAENILNGNVKSISWDEVATSQDAGAVLLDVRTPDEVLLGTIEGSLNIPLDSLRQRLNEVPRGVTLIVFCAVGLRGYLAARILQQCGYPAVYNLSGGYKTYICTTKKQSNENIFNERLFANEYVEKDDVIYQSKPVLPQGLTGSMGDVRLVDACGLQCPGPILRLKQEIDKIHHGQRIQVTATDRGFANDIEAWCHVTGHTLLSLKEEGKKYIGLIERTDKKTTAQQTVTDQKSIIVFSDDLDRALASFVIANGAASMGKKVTMFFTFWGLNVIKKSRKPSVRKDLMGRMFGLMMPSSSFGLKLSKMNMLGIGTLMMRMRMKAKEVDSLEEMMSIAQKNGIELVACQMSMDIMGVEKEELLDTVSIGGVATYLATAEKANLNLFI